MSEDRRAEFVDLAPLWKPRNGGGNCIASGPLTGAAQLLLPGARGRNAKLMVMRVEERRSESSPEFRVVLVMDGEERQAQEQSGNARRDFDDEPQQQARPPRRQTPPASGGYDDDGDDPFASG